MHSEGNRSIINTTEVEQATYTMFTNCTATTRRGTFEVKDVQTASMQYKN